MLVSQVILSVNDVPYAQEELETEITAAVERIVAEIEAVFLQMILDAHSKQCENVSMSIEHPVLY